MLWQNPEDGKKYKTRSGKTERLVDLLDEAVDLMYKNMVARDEETIAAGKTPSVVLSPEEQQAAARVLGYVRPRLGRSRDRDRVRMW